MERSRSLSVPSANTSSPPDDVISDGSALAAVSLDSGHKFAYFQAPSGEIRRASYLNSAWSLIDVFPQSLTGLVANNTPLSIVVTNLVSVLSLKTLNANPPDLVYVSILSQ